MADESRIAQLIYSKLRGELLIHEQEELEQWLKQNPANQALLDEYSQEAGLLAELSKMDGLDEAEGWKQFLAEMDAVAGDTVATADADLREEDVVVLREAEIERNEKKTGIGEVWISEMERIEREGIRIVGKETSGEGNKETSGKGNDEGNVYENGADEKEVIMYPTKTAARRIWPYGVAACGFAAVVGSWLYFQSVSSKKEIQASNNNIIAQAPTEKVYNDLAPSENRARLILADGTLIQLDTLKTGSRLASDPEVWKKDSNTIVLGKGSGVTVSVPARAMYHVQLPDGTRTLLNARSTLKWLSSYNNSDRRVELEGEGYFDVAKDETHPFYVKTSRLEVQALGTAFDLRDYQNENRQQAVLESGKLIVHKKNKDSVILLPRQSAVANTEKPGLLVNEQADVENLLAWKRGYFNFDKRDIRDAVQCIAQWYGVGVSLPKDIGDETLGNGNFQRDLPLGRLLEDLEMRNLHLDVAHDSIVVRRDR